MQRPFSVSSRWLLGVALAGFAFSLVSQTAEARPAYKKVFEETYPAVKQANAISCTACHGTSKKVRNNYGEAVTKALGETNVKDADEITTAFKKVEPAASSVEGKTFGDLLKEGKLPGDKAPE